MDRKHMRPITLLRLLLFIMAFIAAAGNSLADDTASIEEIYFEANRAYKDERFREAVEGYLRLIGSGYVNGHLYYNLGNAYYRTGRLGRAILNYRRARLLIPRDADLNFNLQYALDQTQDAIAPDPNYLAQAFFWLDGLTLRELMWGFGVLNAMFWGILVLRLFVRYEWTYYVLVVLLIFWLAGGVSLGVKWYQLVTDQRAVILAGEIDVMAGPASGDTVLFKLHEGSTVRRERMEDGWSLIRLSESKRGWVASSAIEMILAGRGGNDN